MIKAVIFDWGNVLIANKEEERFAYYCKILGVHPEKLRPVHDKYLPYFDTGDLDEQTFWLKVQQDLGLQEMKTLTIWKAAWSHSMVNISGSWDLARDLKKKNYKLALLSNCEKPTTEMAVGKDYELFDAKVFSCMEGIRKPDREIYEITLKKLGVKPEEAVFIDDKESYVEGAKFVGLRTILFKSPQQTKEELENHGAKI